MQVILASILPSQRSSLEIRRERKANRAAKKGKAAFGSLQAFDTGVGKQAVATVPPISETHPGHSMYGQTALFHA